MDYTTEYTLALQREVLSVLSLCRVHSTSIYHFMSLTAKILIEVTSMANLIGLIAAAKEHNRFPSANIADQIEVFAFNILLKVINHRLINPSGH